MLLIKWIQLKKKKRFVLLKFFFFLSTIVRISRSEYKKNTGKQLLILSTLNSPDVT